MYPTQIRSHFIFVTSFGLLWLCLFAGSLAYTDKVVRDWEAYCDDLLVCRVSTRLSGQTVYSIELQRNPAANAPLVFSIMHQGKLEAGSSILLSVPGELETFSLKVGDGSGFDGVWRFEGVEIEASLIPAMRAGDSLRIIIETDEGVASQTASLSGVSAVMLFTDEVQDRLGKTDALVAKGDSEATGRQTLARGLESSADLPAAVLQGWRDHPYDCTEEDRDLIASFSGYEIRADTDENVRLFIIPCGGPGAYNLIYAGFVFDGQSAKATSLSFPTMSEKGPTNMETIINAGWDEDTRRLSAFAKGRGLGDCGTASMWEWNNNGIWGAFVLVEERRKTECDMKDDAWPLVWPTQ